MKKEMSASLSKRLLVRILIASTIITTVMTLVSFYFDYLTEMGVLNDTFTQLESVTLPSLSRSIYDADKSTTQLQLDNITKLASIISVEIYDPKGKPTQNAKAQVTTGQNLIVKTYPLVYVEDKLDLGKAVITATKKYIYERIIKKAVLFFFTQGLKTFATSIIILQIINHLVVNPLIKLNRAAEKLSTGNMDYEISHSSENQKKDEGALEMSRKDELGTLSRTFVEMKKNIASKIAVIEEYARDLEAKVQERTAELQKKTNNINAILQNMKQGILTVTSSMTIHPEYSKHLEEILEKKDLSDLPVVSTIFTRSDFSEDIKSQIHSALNSIIGEDPLAFVLNEGLLPRTSKLVFDDGRVKLIEIDWNKILENDIVERVVATVRDVTELRRLEQESEAHRRELEMIGEILLISQKDFSEFVNNSLEFINQNHALLSKSKERDSGVIAVLFRNMHTIKGNARLHGFKRICEAVHKAEQTYDMLRLREQVDWDSAQLIDELKAVENLIKKYSEISEIKLGRSNTDASHDDVVISRSFINSLSEPVLNLNVDNPGEVRDTFDKLKAFFTWVNTFEFSECVSGILKGMPILARELGKEPPDVKIHNQQIRLSKPENDLLKNILMHSFRNAIDHGIESPEERMEAGKPVKGNIYIAVDIVNFNLRIHQKDDGRGLDLKAIREKAIEREVIRADQQLTLQETANLVFIQGMSTAKKVTHISGRGVGMNVIKKFVEAEGGTVELVLDPGSERDGCVPFHISITIPRHRQFKDLKQQAA
ncbi:MAG: Hpt domain-containing protein [Oligoflexales bacterium]|nr:Hpt domain-containing protein [Oligoflexales bacterium]